MRLLLSIALFASLSVLGADQKSAADSTPVVPPATRSPNPVPPAAAAPAGPVLIDQVDILEINVRRQEARAIQAEIALAKSRLAAIEKELETAVLTIHSKAKTTPESHEIALDRRELLPRRKGLGNSSTRPR